MMIFDPWLGGDLSDYKDKFDTRKEECPFVWGVLRGVGISAQAVNIISIMIIQIILRRSMGCNSFTAWFSKTTCWSRCYFFTNWYTPYSGDVTNPCLIRFLIIEDARDFWTPYSCATFMLRNWYWYRYLLKSSSVRSFVLAVSLVPFSLSQS